MDEKGRLLIPVELRRGLAAIDGQCNAVVLVRGHNGHLKLMPTTIVARLMKDIEAKLHPTPEEIRKRYDFAMTRLIEVDKQGRVIIPEKYLKQVTLGRDLALVGAVDCIELWNREEWDKFEAELQRQPGPFDQLSRN